MKFPSSSLTTQLLMRTTACFFRRKIFLGFCHFTSSSRMSVNLLRSTCVLALGQFLDMWKKFPTLATMNEKGARLWTGLQALQDYLPTTMCLQLFSRAAISPRTQSPLHSRKMTFQNIRLEIRLRSNS